MSEQISLKKVERNVFRRAFDDGLWDVFLGCFFLIFAIAPLLSASLGDFWSSVIFAPFWLLVYLIIRWIRSHVTSPRNGIVNFGAARKGKLMRFSLLALVLNLVVFTLGITAALRFSQIPGQVFPIFLGVMLVVGFSLAAYFLDMPRLFLYGLMVGTAPLVGEWLWSQGKAAHHGFPVVFGVSSGVMILVGLIVFAQVLRSSPQQPNNLPATGTNDG